MIVLGNTGDGGDRRTVETVRRYLASPDPILREHAAWAAARLGLDARLDTRINVRIELGALRGLTP